MGKGIYRIEILTLKVIPMILSLIYLLNTLLSYYMIDIPLFSWVGGVSALPWLFLYISSLAFHFCLYHRMFLYYLASCNIISCVDYHTGGIYMSDREFLLLNIIIAGISLFIILFLKFKICKHLNQLSSKSSKKH